MTRCDGNGVRRKRVMDGRRRRLKFDPNAVGFSEKPTRAAAPTKNRTFSTSEETTHSPSHLGVGAARQWSCRGEVIRGRERPTAWRCADVGNRGAVGLGRQVPSRAWETTGAHEGGAGEE